MQIRKWSATRLAMAVIIVIGLSGCAGVTTALNGVDGFLTNTAVPDVCKAAAFYESYVVGVVDAITSFPVVAATAGPYITMANTAIAALYSDCQSGALLATIQADMTNVQNAINQLNTTVGNQAKSNPALQAVIY